MRSVKKQSLGVLTLATAIVPCLICMHSLRAAGDSTPGSFLKSYVSEIDGSSQVYGIYVPSPYDPLVAHPVAMNGHGFGGSANASFSDWQKSWADAHGWLLVKLDGRGNTFYDGVGEDDMFRVLEEISAEYNIDEDRIYFEGGSMGATGAFRQGFRHPDLFAAVAGVDGWGYYPLWHRHWYAPANDPYHVDGSQAPLLQAGCAYHLAENGRNLNVWIIVDSGDGSVWPDNGRYVHQRLQDLGYSHDYTENPGGHCASYNIADLYNYFDGKERDPSPDHVTLKANQIRHGEAYWVRMDRLKISMEFGRIDALVSGTDIQVTTTNVLAYTLKLADSPLAGEPSVTVYQNGSSVYTGTPDEVSVYATIDTMGNSITGWSTNDTLPSVLHKTASTEGPFAHAFESSFIVVYGDTQDQQEANNFCADWNSWMKASITSIPDSSVTQDDIDNSNLILFGTENSNSIIASIAANLPFSVTQSTIAINGESYDSTTHGIFVIYPNPANQSRYIAICHGEISGDTAKKMEALPWYWPDFVVFDSVNSPPMSVQAPYLYLAGSFVDSGFFDQYWKTPNDDTDGDGLPNSLDSDDDGDTLSDANENLYGSNPLNADSDGDGVTDGSEVEWNVDTDSDSMINAMDVDSDNDGYTDYMESFYGTSPVVSGEYPSILRVNFQPQGASAPGGFLKDSGSGYTTGRAYGW
ncbi:MAG: hypothetical protein P9M00_09165 [Candidatus Tritonobacter lacicola]|nr:hypothetical protein [Candidatus Tritonobacter lacicola]